MRFISSFFIILSWQCLAAAGENAPSQPQGRSSYIIHESCNRRFAVWSESTGTETLRSTIRHVMDYIRNVNYGGEHADAVLEYYFSNKETALSRAEERDHSAQAARVFRRVGRDPDETIHIRCARRSDIKCGHGDPGFIERGSSVIYICRAFFTRFELFPTRPIITLNNYDDYRLNYCWDDNRRWKDPRSPDRSSNKALTLLWLIFQSRALKRGIPEWTDPRGITDVGAYTFTGTREDTVNFAHSGGLRTLHNALSYVFAAEQTTYLIVCGDWFEKSMRGYTIKQIGGKWAAYKEDDGQR